MSDKERTIKVSYHTHSQWSDGVAPISSMIDAARRERLDEFGISDHLVLTPEGLTVGWTLPPQILDEYVAQVKALADTSTTPIVRLGIEADFFPGTVDVLRDTLAKYPFDYVIGSAHFVGPFPIDEHARHYDALAPDGRLSVWRDYWCTVRRMAETRLFDIAAHLDLPKKFGHYRNAPVLPEMVAALDAIAAADMSIEINTAGWSLPAREAYPSLTILQAAHARGIPLLISADAHHPKHLTRDFARARDLARQAGYTETVRYAGRKRTSVPM